MENHDGKAHGLLDFMEAAGAKGYMNPSTAKAYQASITQVLDIDGEGWEQKDVLSLDVDDQLHRFRQLKGKNYTAESMKSYEQRFKKGLTLYAEYLQNGHQMPRELMAKGQRNKRDGDEPQPKKRMSTPKVTPAAKATPDAVTSSNNGSAAAQQGTELVDYKFPLRPSLLVQLKLPMDLTANEAERLARYVSTLAFEPQRAIEANTPSAVAAASDSDA